MTTVAAYVERVRAALGDLPPRTRDELLEDLPEHLAEVAASGDEPLESLVGPPEAYAAELRTAAIVEAPARRAAVVGQIRDRLRVVDTRIGPLIGYASASEFGRQLRPAWWVVRGYLVAMAVAFLLNQGPSAGLLPRLRDSSLAAVLMLVVFVAGSVWLGRRADRLPRAPRAAIATATVVLAGVALLLIVTADERWRGAGFVEQVSYDRYAGIEDIYVYDKDGRPLRDITLTDQNGVPIRIGTENRIELCGPADPALYPHCPNLTPPLQPLPRSQIVPVPAPSPSATG